MSNNIDNQQARGFALIKYTATNQKEIRMEHMKIMARWHMRCAEMPGRSRIFLHGNSLCECNKKLLNAKR
jgi:hypothetical protein